ncbi:restriction endonuclease subunit S [Streptococcus tangpeifui]|uniref:restriction endonuclease subunit S n=1 Tax=Streptococcus tangpeifui TaxID=2709400 RepID=UPI001F154432|nr:restriction endonuclease subunit S [Streptococcus sp. ZJ1593]
MKQNVPKLRFKELEEEWKYDFLSNLVDKVREKNTENKYTETLTNSAEFGIVNQRDFFDKDISNKKNLDGYYVVRPDDFVYNPRISNLAPVGPIKRNKLGRVGVMSPLYFVFRGKENYRIDLNFLETYFQSNHWHRFMKLNGDSGARSDRFAIKDSVFITMPLPLPSLLEQSAIGSLFQMLDELLSAYKDNLANYQAFKASMLSKMFPKAGQTTPEIRLDGFDGEWEEKKLGDIGSVAMNKRIFKDETSEQGDIPFFKIGTFGGEPDAFITREKFEEYKNKYPYPEVGDILISASGSIGRTVEYKGEEAYFQDSNIVWLKHNGRLDNQFLKQFYSIVKWSGIEGTTIKRLYNKNILETTIFVPDIEEQKLIGAFFLKLDSLMSSYQEKIDQLETLKKKLLQDMFV